MAGKVIFLTGLSGIGKNAAAKPVVDSRPNWTNANFSDIMLELALSKHLVERKDELSIIPISAQKKLQSQTFKKLKSMAKKSDLIINTHAVIPIPNGVYPGLPEEHVKMFRKFQVMFVNITLPADKMDVLVARKMRSRGTELFTSNHNHVDFEQKLANIGKKIDDKIVLFHIMALEDDDNGKNSMEISIGGLPYRVEANFGNLTLFEPKRNRAEYSAEQLVVLDTQARNYLTCASFALAAPIKTIYFLDGGKAQAQGEFLALVDSLDAIKERGWRQMIKDFARSIGKRMF